MHAFWRSSLSREDQSRLHYSEAVCHMIDRMRKMQTNKLALAKQLSDHKRLCQKKYTECHGQTDLEETFRNWLNKQKAAIQRKINGKEIKNKKDLQKFIDLYDSYLSKLGSSASESFIEEIVNQ